MDTPPSAASSPSLSQLARSTFPGSASVGNFLEPKTKGKGNGSAQKCERRRRRRKRRKHRQDLQRDRADEDDDDDDQTVPDQGQPQAASATDSPTTTKPQLCRPQAALRLLPAPPSPLLLPRLCLCHFCIMNRRSVDGTAAETELTDWDMEMEGWHWDWDWLPL